LKEGGRAWDKNPGAVYFIGLFLTAKLFLGNCSSFQNHDDHFHQPIHLGRRRDLRIFLGCHAELLVEFQVDLKHKENRNNVDRGWQSGGIWPPATLFLGLSFDHKISLSCVHQKQSVINAH